jgi:Pregnancy-associated plasma protein-A/Secretion system C-terminal sorting domain
MKYILFFLFIFQTSFSQELKRCFDSTMMVNNSFHRLKNSNLKSLDDIRMPKNARKFEGIVKIPVVVHIIHNNKTLAIGGANNGNISRDQVLTQIQVLNEDFRHKTGTLGFGNGGADTEIEFFLAIKDPNGNPTTGINRIYEASPSFDLNRDLSFMASLSYWDSKKYLNVWVTTLQKGYLGYGSTPYVPSLDLTDEEIDTEDGVFVDHRNFGKKIGTANSTDESRVIYNYGRTLTHELGHWLGLYHTWGDEFCGDDYVDDTPTTNSANQTRFCREKFSTCNGTRTRNLIENYMDYTPDSCMNMFTEGQKIRMRKVIELAPSRRMVALNGASMLLPKTSNLEASIFPNPVSNYLFFKVLIPDNQQISIDLIDNTGFVYLARKTIEKINSFVDEIDVQQLKQGLYLLRISTQTETKVVRFFKN